MRLVGRWHFAGFVRNDVFFVRTGRKHYCTPPKRTREASSGPATTFPAGMSTGRSICATRRNPRPTLRERCSEWRHLGEEKPNSWHESHRYNPQERRLKPPVFAIRWACAWILHGLGEGGQRICWRSRCLGRFGALVLRGRRIFFRSGGASRSELRCCAG